jgi:hypothetical protein
MAVAPIVRTHLGDNMQITSPLRTVAAVIAGMALSSLAQAQPMLYDADGNVVGTPSPAGNFLSAYVNINGSLVTLLFYEKHPRSIDLEVSSEGYLYFRSPDCSGPAFVEKNGAGTMPAAVFAEKNHAWIHIAEDRKGLGMITTNSIMGPHKACHPFQTEIAAWKVGAGIDLYALFKPPFSLH